MFACGVIFHLCLTGSFPYSLSINNNTTICANSAADFAVSSNDKEMLRKELQTSKRPFAPSKPVNTFLFPPENHRNNQSAAPKRRVINAANIVLTERECVDEALRTVHKLLNENPAVRMRAGALLYSDWLQRGVKQEKTTPSFSSLFFDS